MAHRSISEGRNNKPGASSPAIAIQRNGGPANKPTMLTGSAPTRVKVMPAPVYCVYERGYEAIYNSMEEELHCRTTDFELAVETFIDLCGEKLIYDESSKRLYSSGDEEYIETTSPPVEAFKIKSSNILRLLDSTGSYSYRFKYKDNWGFPCHIDTVIVLK